MIVFTLNKTYSVVCEVSSTRNGFKHTATLYRNGIKIDITKVNYLNRTWECFPYESVLLQMIDQTVYLMDKEKRRFINKIKVMR